MKKQLYIQVYGKVQGVFFRSQAAKRAQELGLKGWIRNSDDGTVEIVAQGEDSALTVFSEWCRVGPPGSDVERTHWKWSDQQGEFKGFETRE